MGKWPLLPATGLTTRQRWAIHRLRVNHARAFSIMLPNTFARYIANFARCFGALFAIPFANHESLHCLFQPHTSLAYIANSIGPNTFQQAQLHWRYDNHSIKMIHSRILCLRSMKSSQMWNKTFVPTSHCPRSVYITRTDLLPKENNCVLVPGRAKRWALVVRLMNHWDYLYKIRKYLPLRGRTQPKLRSSRQPLSIRANRGNPQWFIDGRYWKHCHTIPDRGETKASTRKYAYPAMYRRIIQRTDFVTFYDTCEISPTSMKVRREEKPTRCHGMVYCTYKMLNMFREPLCPSSGARDYVCYYCLWCAMPWLLVVGGQL